MKFSGFMRLFCLLAAVLAWSSTTLADQITLSSGEQLKGTVVEQNEQHVVFRHAVLGELTIPLAEVAQVVIGDAPAGQDAAAAEGEVREDGEPMAEDQREAAAERGDADADPALVAPPDAADQPVIEEKPDGPFAFLSRLIEEWDHRLEVGFTGSHGNTRSSSFRLSLDSQMETAADRWNIRATYFHATDAGETSRNEFDFIVNKDWFLPDSPWLFFARGSYEYDQFRQWKQRVSGFGGMGLTLVKEDDLEIVLRAGAGVTKELKGRRDLKPEGLISAAVIKWNFTKGQTLSTSHTFFPALDEFGEFRLLSDLVWQIRVSDVDGLSLRFGLENEYQTDPGAGQRRNDFKYYGALVFEF